MDALKTLLREQGWTLVIRQRRKQKKEYLYAARMESKPRRRQERYIAPMSKLPELTSALVIEKLWKKEGDSAMKSK